MNVSSRPASYLFVYANRRVAGEWMVTSYSVLDLRSEGRLGYNSAWREPNVYLGAILRVTTPVRGRPYTTLDNWKPEIFSHDEGLG